MLAPQVGVAPRQAARQGLAVLRAGLQGQILVPQLGAAPRADADASYGLPSQLGSVALQAAPWCCATICGEQGSGPMHTARRNVGRRALPGESLVAVAAALCLVRRRSGSEPWGRLNLSAEGVHEEMVGKNGLGIVYIG